MASFWIHCDGDMWEFVTDDKAKAEEQADAKARERKVTAYLYETGDPMPISSHPPKGRG